MLASMSMTDFARPLKEKSTCWNLILLLRLMTTQLTSYLVCLRHGLGHIFKVIGHYSMDDFGRFLRWAVERSRCDRFAVDLFHFSAGGHCFFDSEELEAGRYLAAPFFFLWAAVSKLACLFLLHTSIPGKPPPPLLSESYKFFLTRSTVVRRHGMDGNHSEPTKRWWVRSVIVVWAWFNLDSFCAKKRLVLRTPQLPTPFFSRWWASPGDIHIYPFWRRKGSRCVCMLERLRYISHVGMMQ